MLFSGFSDGLNAAALIPNLKTVKIFLLQTVTFFHRPNNPKKDANLMVCVAKYYQKSFSFIWMMRLFRATHDWRQRNIFKPCGKNYRLEAKIS
jgi:hypothetical protein